MDKKADAGIPGAVRRWLPAVGAGLLVIVLSAALFRPPPPPPAAPAAPRVPVVRLVRPPGNGPDSAAGGDLSAEDAALNDPTPLFLPTRWSSAQKDVPPPPPEGSFTGLCPEARLSQGQARPRPGPPAPPMRAAEVLRTGPLGSNPLIGIGWTDSPVPPLGPRLACVSAVDVRTGRVRIYSAKKMDEFERMRRSMRKGADGKNQSRADSGRFPGGFRRDKRSRHLAG